MSNPTDIGQFIGELNGGVFDEQVSLLLSTVSAAVIDHRKVGQVQLTFNIKQVGESHQVTVSHELKFKQPTARGAIIQNDLTDTIMHVGVGGKTTLFPETQVPKGQMHLGDKDNIDNLVHGSKS